MCRTVCRGGGLEPLSRSGACSPSGRVAGTQRSRKVSSPGSAWTKTEVTLSSEWKTRELRQMGMASARGPEVCAKFITRSVVEVGAPTTAHTHAKFEK